MSSSPLTVPKRKTTPITLAIVWGYRIAKVVYSVYLVTVAFSLLIYLLTQYFQQSEIPFVAYIGAWIVFAFLGFFIGGITMFGVGVLLTSISASIFWAIRIRINASLQDGASVLLALLIYLSIAMVVNLSLQAEIPVIFYYVFVAVPSMLYVIMGGWIGYSLPRYSQGFFKKHEGQGGESV